MKTFTNTKELEEYILTQSEIAVYKAREKVVSIINHFLSEYYREFEPEVYARTYQLLNSLVKTEIKPTGKGWIAEVYFDSNALDYSEKTLNGVGTWSNSYKKSGWTHENDEWVLENAMIGNKPHGNYAPGTAVWTQSMKFLKKEGIKILKEKLRESGVPVK